MVFSILCLAAACLAWRRRTKYATMEMMAKPLSKCVGEMAPRRGPISELGLLGGGGLLLGDLLRLGLLLGRSLDGAVLLEVLDLLEVVLLPLNLLEVSLELLECLGAADPGEAMDLASADPDPLGPKVPAEAEPVDPDGVCDCLSWGELLGGYNSPPWSNP